MTDTQQQIEYVVRTIAQTAIDNEKYFGDLDAVVGDGDFGYSLARGFEKVLEGWDDIDRSDPGTFLKKVGMIVSSRIGGTSGPIWGTAFMKAGIAAGTAVELDRRPGRGDAARGHRRDQDARPVRRRRQDAAGRAGPDDRPDRAGTAGRAPTLPGCWRRPPPPPARRPRRRATWSPDGGGPSYTGERSRGSVDAGAMAVAVIAANTDRSARTGWPNRGGVS